MKKTTENRKKSPNFSGSFESVLILIVLLVFALIVLFVLILIVLFVLILVLVILILILIAILHVLSNLLFDFRVRR